MSAIFDNPYVIAAINAKTLAMAKFETDLDQLDSERVRRMYFDVVKRSPGEDMERIIEFVLNLHEPYVNDAERGGYKIAIGMAIHEVKKLRDAQLKLLEGRDVPLYAYEQDL